MRKEYSLYRDLNISNLQTGDLIFKIPQSEIENLLSKSDKGNFYICVKNQQGEKTVIYSGKWMPISKKTNEINSTTTEKIIEKQKEIINLLPPDVTQLDEIDNIKDFKIQIETETVNKISKEELLELKSDTINKIQPIEFIKEIDPQEKTIKQQDPIKIKKDLIAKLYRDNNLEGYIEGRKNLILPEDTQNEII